MGYDVEVTAGVVSTAVKTGLAEMRKEVRSTTADITRDLGRAITFGGIAAAMEQVLEKAHEIHHQAERFGVDAKFLQVFANAAELDGVSLGRTASGMNKLIISQQKARDGSDKLTNAFGVLGISQQDIAQLDTPALMLRIADGVKGASDKTAAYAAVAAILGSKMGTDLIPTLERGSAAIEEVGNSMGVLDDDTLKSLDEIRREFEVTKSQAFVGLGETMGVLVKAWQVGVAYMSGQAIAFKDLTIGAFSAINRALHFDFSGAKREWEKAQADVIADTDAAADKISEILDKKHGSGDAAAAPGSRGHIGLDASEANPEDIGGGGRSSDDKAADEHEAAQERINKLNDEHAARQRTAQQQLGVLETQRLHLQRESEALTRKELAGTIDQGARDELNLKIAENQKDIDGASKKLKDDQAKTEKEISAEKEKQQAAADKYAAQSAADLQDSQERSRELQEQLAGHEDIAKQLKIAYDFDLRIQDALDHQNQTLADQLTAEKNLTLEAQKRADEEEKAVEAKKKAEEQAAAHEEAKRKQIDYASEAGGRGVAAGLRGIGNQNSLLTSGASYADVARIRTPNDPRAIQRAQGLDMLAALSGKNVGFFEQLRLDSIVRQYAKEQTQFASQQAAAAARSQYQYWQGIASGGTPPVNPQLMQMLQAMLSQLQDTHLKVAEPPG